MNKRKFETKLILCLSAKEEFRQELRGLMIMAFLNETLLDIWNRYAS